MSIARKCDLCGKLYELYNIGNIFSLSNGFKFINKDEDGGITNHKSIDCCPECLKSIQDHIESLKKGE